MTEIAGADLSNVLTAEPKGRLVTELTAPLDQLLYDHAAWVTTGGERGKPVDLSGFDLRAAFPIADVALTAIKAIGTIFYGLKLPAAQMQYGTFDKSDMRGCDFSRGDLRGISLSHALLNMSNLAGAKLGPLELPGGRMKTSNLTGALLRHVNLKGADLTQVDFTNADCSFTDFTGANLHGVKFKDARLTGAILTAANLDGVDLSIIADARDMIR